MACSTIFSPRAWLIAAAMVLPVTGWGCSLLATGLWVLDPNDTEAEYKGLKEQRVAVVCRAGAASQMEAAGATHEIARQVSALLKKNVPHIRLISQKDVDDWMDNNEMKSCAELGKALRADKVVAIDLAQLSLYDGKTLFQGRAQANLTVYDIRDGSSVELRPADVSYPPKNGVPTDIPEQQFRARFLEVLCGQLARRFYRFDSGEVDDNFYSETPLGFSRH
ncbi:MAG: hypothetical protein K8T91_15280 [Planctomycetes bacterium]|nr:hypothetical protein [Planctomycetota bacterium]